MEIHPRIRRRIRQNWIAKEVEIRGHRDSVIRKLNGVLDYLYGANILSDALDVDSLIADIETVRSEFISFKTDAENPVSIRDAVVPRINQIHDKLKQLELEQETRSARSPSA